MSLLRLLFVAAFAVTNATHIAFMTVSWTRQGATNTFNFNWQMALRATFFSPYPVKGATSHNIGNAQYQTASNGAAYANRALLLVPVEVYASDDWFIGTTVQAQAVSSATAQQRLYFTQCCRISTLLQGNNDGDGTIYAWMDPRESAGPSSTGLAREYFFLGQPANYVVPAVSPQNRGFKFEIPPGGQTGLVATSPTGSGFALDQVTGRFTWVPTRTGLYAIQVKCTDGNWNGGTFTATLNSIPVDFIMQVIAPCNLNDPSCNRPPYLVKDLVCGAVNPVAVACLLPFEKNFFRGVEGTFQIFGKDDNAQDTVTVINSALPDGAAFYQEVTGNPCTYRFKWTPAIDQVSAIVCFKAKDSRGLFATGNYCVKCNIGNAALIYVSGIIRDFQKAHADMNKANGDAGKAIVTTTLGADDKPVFNAAVGALATVSGKTTFDQWFNDVNGVNKRMVFSLTLSNGTEADGRIFTFLSTVLWPIDNLLFGNEGEAHNNYYTYEVATYMTYYGREVFIFQSADDLWVYVDRVLPATPAWSLAGVHAVLTYTLTMDTAFTKALVTGTTYPCHIFFAHRGNAHSPALQLELPQAVLCNALQSGVTTINLPSFTGTANQRITTWGAAAISSAVLRIMDMSAVFNSGSAWYSEQQGAAGQQTWQPIPLKILYGFSTTFNFIYSSVTGGGAEGFAFVLQSQGPGARGGEGSNLGYSNIERSLAFEFDSNTNLNLGDPSYDHVSVHTRYTAPNDPSEIYSLGISAAVPAMTLANNTVHRIRLEYMPARDDKGSTVRKGWLRLWMNDNIAPLMQAIVDGGDLANTFGAAAYGGFTSGSSDVKRASIDIQNWNLIVVPPSAARSSLVAQPADLTAGNTGSVVVQTRDACGNDIKVGEEAYLFSVNIKLQKGGKVSWNSTVTSNHDGTYTISYAPTVAGLYDISVLFGEGANAFPILNSPFTMRVVPAATSALTSTYVYGRLPTQPSNALFPEGLWVIQIEPVNGIVMNQRMYDFSGTDRYATGGPAAFNTFIGSVPANHIVAMAAVGDIKPLLTNTEVNTARTFGAQKLGQYAAYGSYAVIGVKGEATATKEEVWPDQATTELVRSFGNVATGFDVTAESAGRDFGAYGRLNVVPHTIYVNAASTSQFTVVARDRFGNKVVSGGDPFNLAFNPDIQASGGTIFPMLYPFAAHYQMSWTSSVAGNYDMFVKLAATNIVRSPVSLKVIPAAADCHTSFATGSGLTVGYATVPTYFTLYLNDQYGNLLQQPNPNAPDVVTCTLSGPSTANPKLNVPAVGNWVVVGNAQELRMTYTATRTGLYDLVCVVNGCNLDDTQGQQITVFPGNANASECVAAGMGIDTNTVVKAGTPATFTVQSYDTGGNLIEIENAYMFTVTYSGNVVDDSIKYDGLGKYLIQYTPTQATTYTITVKLPARAGDPNAPNIGGGPICRLTVACKTSPFTVAVQAGDASYLSVVQTPLPSPVTAGVLNPFDIIAKDKLLNLVTDRQQASKFLVKLETDPAETLSIFKADSTIAASLTQPEKYTVNYNCTKAATYTVTVVTTTDGVHLNYLPAQAWSAGQVAPTIVCNPAATSPPHTRIDGDGALGGVFNTQATFTIQARDRFSNNQINTLDTWSVLVLPGYPAGTVTARAGNKGLFDVTYNVPNCNPKPCMYTLRVLFTTGGANTVVYENTAALSSGSALVSYAVPTNNDYLTARVGVQQTWTIRDQDVNGLATAAATTFTVVYSQTVNGNEYYAPNVVVTPAGQVGGFFTYTVTWTPERTGTFSLMIREKGIFKTDASPYTVTVNPGLIYHDNCKIIGLPATKVAGTINTFTVELYDVKNYRITGTAASTYTLTATLDTGAAGTVVGVWTPASNVYTFTYNLTVAGAKLARVEESQKRIQQQTIDLTIDPAPVFAPACTAAGTGLATVTAGSTAFFEITARDRFGNLAAEGNIAWVLNLADGANPPVTFTSFFKGGAKYSITYVPKKTATPASAGFDLSVRILTVGIAGSPFRTVINPAAISQNLTALTTTLGQVTAGDPITFTVATKDIFNNPWKDNVGSQRLIRALALTPRGDTVDANVVNRVGGLYDVTLPGAQTQRAGDYFFSLRAEGVAVNPPSMAAAVRVVAGPVDPLQTIVPSALAPTKVSVKVTFEVTVCDTYGNPILDGRPAEVLQLQFSKGATDCLGEARNLTEDPTANATSYLPATSFTQDACVPTSCNVRPGVYSFTVSSNKIGIFQLGVIFVRGQNRIQLPCSSRTALNIQILPGDPDPASSLISGPTAGLAGNNLVYWVEIRDSDDNPIGRSLDASTPFRFGAEGASGGQPATVLGAPGGGVSVTVTDFGNSTYRVVAVPTAKGDYAVMGSIGGVRISGTSANPFSPVDRVSISPNVAFSFQVPVINGPVAGIPGSFTLQATDKWKNTVTTTMHTYTVRFSRKGSAYTFQANVTALTLGQHRVDYLSQWHGDFDVSIDLIDQYGVKGDSGFLPVKILHQTCAFDNPGPPVKAIRCPPSPSFPNGECVASFQQCTPPVSVCPTAKPYACADGSCQADASQCPCPGVQVRCPQGNCVTGSSSCPVAQPCPLGASYACKDGAGLPTGECRADASGCPSPVACTPGYVLCPSGVSCARTVADCPALPTCAPGTFACPSGTCVANVQDCPTSKTCASAGDVVCASDGSCQASADKCPDQYKCYPPNDKRCPDGSCRADAATCPTPVTCPWGYVLCQNGQCAPTVAQCLAPFPCGADKVRCADGTCLDNLLLCPSVSICLPANPIKCSDGSCVASSFDCSTPTQCPASGQVCIDGTCIVPGQQCPTRTTCPLAAPILCNDGMCVASTTACTVVAPCPPATPHRCPDGACRGAPLDCPSQSVCPATIPVRCPDGKCVVASDNCVDVSKLNCPNAADVRCPGGECAPTQALCPTHVTCPSGFEKCLDGTCRVVGTCPLDANVFCASGRVTCPQAGMGVSCAATLAECPTTQLCPTDRPVKCLDATCGLSVNDCPMPPTTYEDGKIACPDGSWTKDITQCGTPVTCPADYPYKCYDDTCRRNPADCPVAGGCPNLAAFPKNIYLCPNGNCVERLTDAACQSDSIPCSDLSTTPVKCPTGECKSSINQCFLLDPTCDPADPLCVKPQDCPILTFHRCRDGSCKADAANCATTICPSAVPFLCPDGLCTTDASKCNRANGCPWDKPNQCLNGLCVTPDYTCPAAPTCTTGRLCAGGFCADDCSDFELDGCPRGFTRCNDKSCVAKPTNGRVSSCIAGTPDAQGDEPLGNSCPVSRPFQCTDGFCALTATLCPVSSTSQTCPASSPFRCADGSCVLMSTSCPLVYPCPKAYVRCNDGSCREAQSYCPFVNTCPTDVPFRCPNGLCATAGSTCLDETTGCPGGFVTRCSNGACIRAGQTCADVTRPANGCPAASPYRCNDGSCVVAQNMCPNAVGCLEPNVFRCPLDGVCIAPTGTCAPQATACANKPFICADGTCAATPGDCEATNGCKVATPYRCANGTCVKDRNSCPAAVSCGQGETLCYNGVCEVSASLCKTAPACEAAKPFICANGECAASAATCPNTRSCPTATPVLCADGSCRTSPNRCPSTTTNTNNGALGGGVVTSWGDDLGCAAPTPRRCFDGSCRATPLECMEWTATIVNNAATTLTTPQAVLAVCPQGMTLCADGSCQANARWCPLVGRCPKDQIRCANGACLADASQCTTNVDSKCPSGYWPCEDGTCRESCLDFNGCPTKSLYRYHCANRECAQNALDCNNTDRYTRSPRYDARDYAEAKAAPVNATRRLLQADPRGSNPNGCFSNCRAEVQPALLSYSINTRTAVTLPIAVDMSLVTQGRLIVPSGALQTSNGDGISQLTIFPVGESRMRNAVNRVDPSRQTEFGRFMTFPYTLLSPAFECVTEAKVLEPFAVNVTYKANIDLQRSPDYLDVCLARLVVQTGVVFRTWECVHGNDPKTRIDYPTRPKGTSAPLTEVTGSFQSCGSGTVYAFVHMPREVVPVKAPEQTNYFTKYVVWILLGLVLGIGLVFGCFYFGKRLHRYREKYHEERAQVDRMQEEVNTMEQFGGRAGTKDEEVALTDNPLVMQMADMQRKLEAKDIEMEEAAIAEREAESGIRQGHITALKDDRNALQDELDRLKAELESQNGLRGAATVAPVRGARSAGNVAAEKADIEVKKKKKKQREM